MREQRLFAEFASTGSLVEAVRRIRERTAGPIEVNSPYSIPELDDILGLKRSGLPRVCFASGVAGAAVGLALQWFTNAWDYPLNVGGRPLLSWPAWIPVTLELAILGAAIGGVIGLLVATRLPRLWDAAFEIEGFERVTTDRFWLGAAVRAEDAARVREDLAAAGAIRIASVPHE